MRPNLVLSANVLPHKVSQNTEVCGADPAAAAGLGEAHQHGPGCCQGHAVPAHVPAAHPAQRPQVCQPAGQQALESQGTPPGPAQSANPQTELAINRPKGTILLLQQSANPGTELAVNRPTANLRAFTPMRLSSCLCLQQENCKSESFHAHESIMLLVSCLFAARCMKCACSHARMHQTGCASFTLLLKCFVPCLHYCSQCFSDTLLFLPLVYKHATALR